jgi:hypothetical protein
MSVAVIRRIAKKLYALDIPQNLDPRYEYNLKPLGFYAITLGLLCALELSVNDLNHRRGFLFILAFLLVMRSLGRFFCRDLVQRAFGITWERSRANVIFNIILAALMASLACNISGV